MRITAEVAEPAVCEGDVLIELVEDGFVVSFLTDLVDPDRLDADPRELAATARIWFPEHGFERMARAFNLVLNELQRARRT